MGELGRLIQAYRDQQKYPVSDAQIAKAIGVSRSSIGNWIRGDAVPSPANLRALANHIDTSYLRVFEAAMADAGYLPKERDGDAEHATPTKPARGGSAAGAASKDEVALAAMPGTPAYAQRDATGEHSQDPGHDDPA
jgi:transcriptional regulator with XRE-family HTH domain